MKLSSSPFLSSELCSGWFVSVGGVSDRAARAECLKWLGFALMLVDHCWRYLGLGFPGSFTLGRMCFPCFAIALGAQLGPGSAGRVFRRLILAGCLVSPVFLYVDPIARFDVLVTLAFGVAFSVVAQLLDAPRWARVLLCAVCLVGGSFGEYGAVVLRRRGSGSAR